MCVYIEIHVYNKKLYNYNLARVIWASMAAALPDVSFQYFNSKCFNSENNQLTSDEVN